jgi:Domain of unknown function (DUF4279)
MMKNETKAALIIYEFTESFDQLSQFINLRPTAVQDAIPEKSVPRRWELASGADETAAVEEHLEALLERLERSAEQIRQLASKYRCTISVGVQFHEFNPTIELEPKIIEKLASLGVKLWLDLYNMWDEDDKAAEATVQRVEDVLRPKFKSEMTHFYPGV